jgi:hypothetical protein
MVNFQRLAGVLFAALIGLAPAVASAEGAVPRLHHAPVSVSTAHEPLLVTAEIHHPELVKRAILAYRASDTAPYSEVEFRRGAPGPYVAEVPADAVNPPEISYLIEIEGLDGTRSPVFATRAEPQHVLVPEQLMDARERALLTRLDGRRSVFAVSGEYVDFGYSKANVQDATGTVTPENIHDQFFRVEGSYTYRPLRTITEFSLRIGVVRGNSPVPLSDAQAPGKSGDDRFKVGLNYGAPTVRFRLDDIVHLEAEFLTSVTETGFSVGTGGAILLGDPYGSKLTLGFESIQVFGTRFWSRMDVRASDRIIVSPVVEVTNMPHADDYGVRLLGEVTSQLGSGFSAALRGGYQARVSTGGGPSAGATLGYAF